MFDPHHQIHASDTLMMSEPHHLARWSSFYHALVAKRGWRLWYYHENPGGIITREVHTTLEDLGLRPNMCCYELAFASPRAVQRSHLNSSDAP